ncbi:hypothetical protein LAUMK136_03228 [Mycobacterium attenuatum]|uniref:Uncharacterized protein n=1 Tax=Mycobacterium attenuatum TaxID=2341086 RepID=A0A498Q1A5_9MYCO|nr:hypothetical protein LAUMK136_03228 [Mycobacterium attenuatum]
MACTAVADDNGMRALRDVAAVAADIEYRVIGGHMVRLLRHVYNVPGIPRLTSDADTGIDVNVATTRDLHDRLTALGTSLSAATATNEVSKRLTSWFPPQPNRASRSSANEPSTERQDCAWRWPCRRSKSLLQPDSPTAT